MSPATGCAALICPDAHEDTGAHGAESTLVGVDSWMRRLSCLLSGVALLVTGLGTPFAAADGGWSANPVASSKAADQPCADLLFVGVRGSGEQPPYGTTLSAVEQQLATHTQQSRPDLSVRQVFLDYPATSLDQLNLSAVENMVLPNSSASPSAYTSSVDAGVSELERLAHSEAERCHDQKLLIAGFSQGAEVTTRALASGQLDANTTAVVLLGNPLHYDGQNVNELDGTAGNRAYGLVAALHFLRQQATADPHATRQQQVQSLLTSLFSLYNGTVDNGTLNAAMKSAGADVPGVDAPMTWSVCMSGDTVCDSAEALSRLLTSTSTVQEEEDRARPLHSSYTPANLPKTLAAVEAKIDALPATATGSARGPLPGRSAAPVVGLAVAAAVLAGAVVAVLIGRRRRSGRGSHQ
ncbi:Cutinase [Propionibacterium cyclohexanicum]|uniref:Cutinase n=1 Tax=Propionibacterium cyclohexanicum TaxID=64702 RepID=A0A1H9T1V2_9ACTN|nr:cutinase family protein [Propionibacterium cyclohexanicum]SER90689.1 Cutinase [Propionibacterium cyclohexanicum]